jgi:hypothetical protein
MDTKQKKVLKNYSLGGRNKMKQIRHNVFETNSSSTHSLSIVTKKDFDKWVAGEVYFNDNTAYSSSESEYAKIKFVTKDQAIDIIKKSSYNQDVKIDGITEEELIELFPEEEIYSYDYYIDGYRDELENFEQQYKTESGDEIVAFGKYGGPY